MIKDPPLLTIRRDFRRPRAEDIADLGNVPTGHAVDAMNGRGALDYRIKPLEPMTSPVVGTAVTCHCGSADNLALFAALDVVQPGDILVAATDWSVNTSVTGDMLMGMAKNSGVRALVTDGVVRDLAGILSVGLPVFCVGLSPNSPSRNGPGSVGQPVVLGGVSVSSGDALVLDNDGVVVIPQGEVESVIQNLKIVRAAEGDLEAKVKAGLKLPDFIRKVLASGHIKELPGETTGL
jgi:4-hydroxy-4-methyl-2-oxoglutarate aldolase